MDIDARFLQHTLEELVGCESVNPAFTGSDGQPGRGEGPIARLVAERLRRLGLEATVLARTEERPSVIAKLAGRGGGRSLMLNGHLDTVGPGEMPDPFTPTVRDGRLYGRGAYDMKAGVAACLGAVKALVDANTSLAGDLVVALVADEENASRGTAEVLRHVRADAAIVTEPTELRLCLAHKGFSWIRVTTRGFACHGSNTEEGVDANLRMGRFLTAVGELEQRLRRRPPHELVGRPSIHAPLLRGGIGPSVYSPRCTLQLERRTLPGETSDDVVAEIQGLAQALEADLPRDAVEIEELLTRLPFEAEPNSALATAVAGACEETYGRPPEIVGVPFWTDAALLRSTGVDTVVFGPSGSGAHADEEWVDLASMAACAAMLADSARRFCN